MSVKESGNTLDDVIEYVRVEMYQLHLKDEAIKNKTIVLDDNEDDDNMNIEDEYLCSLKSNSNDKDITSASSDKESIETKDDKQKVMSEIQKSESSKCVTPKNKNARLQNDEKPRIIPPPQWFFPSWISFVQYGPFVSKDKRLPLLEITDASKKVVKSRTEKRKAEKLEKDLKRVNDSSSDRGFNTDQKIQLEIIDLTCQQTNDRSRESIIMGLCVQEAALTKQIDRAERMAERLAPNDIDNINNKWWSKVNFLINEQEKIIIQMAVLNKKAIDKSNGGTYEKQQSILTSNSGVLTNKSPEISVMTKPTEVEVISDISSNTTKE